MRQSYGAMGAKQDLTAVFALQGGVVATAVEEQNGPVAVRYPRGGDGNFEKSMWNPDQTVVTHRQGKHAAIITYGNLLNNALAAAEILAEQGIEVSVVRLTQLSPIGFAELERTISGINHVVLLEDANAGIREALGCVLQNRHAVISIDLGSEFVTHGSITKLHEKYGMDPASIAQKVREVLANEN